MQKPTDHFDFTLNTTRGPKYLELMEVHLGSIGRTLSSGQFVYEPYRAADLLSQHINRKSNRYQGAPPNGIVLLLYATHWQFALSNAALWLLSHSIYRDPPIFESVYYISLSDPGAADVQLLYPTDIDFSNFDPETYRENLDILLDPTNQIEIR